MEVGQEMINMEEKNSFEKIYDVIRQIPKGQAAGREWSAMRSMRFRVTAICRAIVW